MNKLELSPRLAALAALVPQGARLADVGTDHAYLPVRLLLDGNMEKKLASRPQLIPMNEKAIICGRELAKAQRE